MNAATRLERAIQLAAELHRGQTRKGSFQPYILHPFRVASIVSDAGGSEDQVIAAIFHDLVEDAGGQPTRERIQREFGANVTRLVDGCTDAVGYPRPPWRERKQRFIDRVRRASSAVRLLVVADKLHNAMCTRQDLATRGGEVWERFHGRREGTLWYYREMLEALRDGWQHPLLDELESEVDQLHSF